MNRWNVFTGSATPTEPPPDIPAAPSWRSFSGSAGADLDGVEAALADALAPLQTQFTVDMVNAALALRRPLLVTGPPGAGKSTLARLVAVELGLGRVLHWPITSSTRLEHGLYDYDAIGHVRSGQIADETDPEQSDVDYGPARIGRYIRLGPLGTALLPWRRPRVLLIDELDKCDIDLPNDLLHVLENGWFRIRELARLAAGSRPRPVHVLSDDDQPVKIERGRVHCTEFPFVVMTSNQERTFPPALMRRCLPLDLAPPTHDQLTAIVDKLIGNDDDTRAEIGRFVERIDEGHLLATDQLLNLVYLRGLCVLPDEVRAAVARELTG